MYEYLLVLVSAHPLLVYLIILPIAIAEGPIVSLTSGALLFAGYFNFWPLYITLMLGDVIGDVVFYCIGHHYGYRFVTRFGKRFNITEEHIVKVQNLFHRRTTAILFFSKITNGLGFSAVVLFTAGLAKIPFARYLSINLLGQLIWSGILIVTGYFFSTLYVQINDIVGRVTLIFGGVTIGFLVYKYIQHLRVKIDA
jgi:membrane protein DedA with SNARE-associated domain